jgi:uncharacterized membrane protein
MAAEHVPTRHEAFFDRPSVRKISREDLRLALRSGVEDFRSKPSHLLFVSLFYPLFGLFLGAFLFSENAAQLLYPAVLGFALVGPLLATPLYEVSRRRELGEEPSWLDALRVLSSRAIWSIIVLGALVMITFIVWIVIAQAIYALIYGEYEFASFWAFLRDVLTTSRGWALIVTGHLVGLVFAMLAFTIGVVSFPLLVDRDVGAAVALQTSVQAVISNPGPMALWAAIVAALLALGSLPLLVGLTVVMPILGHATWHLYRRTVDQATVAATPLR